MAVGILTCRCCSYVARQSRRQPDATWSAAQIGLLGPLSNKSARIALRRIVCVYERTLVRFPQNYSLWLHYLLRRSSLIAGEPRGGLEAWKKRTLESARQALDAGPGLLEQEEEEEWDWRDGKALDGRVGRREWESLAATCERALMCLPKVRGMCC